MTENLVPLDLSRFTRADLEKIEGLSRKLRLMHRWFRSDRLDGETRDTFALYSGDRGPRPYVGYRIARREDGVYELINPKGGQVLSSGRSINAVIQAIPDDFFYTGR